MSMKSITLVVVACILSACASSVVPPILLNSGELVYPKSEMRAAVEGVVTISYDIDERGYVTNVQIVDSGPSREFGIAAVKFVRTWRFQPQKRSGVPEPVYGVESRISFVLDSGEAPSYLEYVK